MTQDYYTTKQLKEHIGGGTGRPHGPRPLHFYFWEGLARHFQISNFA